MPIHACGGIKKNTEFHTKVKASLVFEQLMCLLSGCHLLPGVIESSVQADKENWKITFSSQGEGKDKLEEEDMPTEQDIKECNHSQANITMQLTRVGNSDELCVEFTHGVKPNLKNFWKMTGSCKTIFFSVYKQVVKNVHL